MYGQRKTSDFKLPERFFTDINAVYRGVEKLALENILSALGAIQIYESISYFDIYPDLNKYVGKFDNRTMVSPFGKVKIYPENYERKSWAEMSAATLRDLGYRTKIINEGIEEEERVIIIGGEFKPIIY